MNQNLPVRRPDSVVPGSSAQANGAFSINEMGIRDILSLIFKHKLIILVSFVLIFCLSGASVLVYFHYIFKPTYEAKSLILVRPGWENQDITLSPNQRQTNFNNGDLLATEVSILRSRELAEKTINTIKPEVIYPDLAEGIAKGLPVEGSALYEFQKGFAVKIVSGNILEASFKGSNPATAARVVNELVNYYIDKRDDTYRNPKVLLYLEQKTDEYRQKFAGAEDKFKAFLDQSKITSFEEQRGFLLNKRRQLADSHTDNQIAITQIQGKTSELERQLPNIQKASIVASEKATDLDGRLFALQLQEQDLLSKYKEDNRLVVNVREQIQMTKNFIASRAPGAKLGPVDPAYQEVQKQILENKAEMSALIVKQKGLDDEIKAVNAEINLFETQESEYNKLFRSVADNQDKYKTYIAKLEEARIHDELDRQKMTSVSVLEPASVPVMPTNVPKPLIVYVAMALFLGIGGSIGLAFVLEMVNPGLSTPAQTERRMELPVLAVVALK